MPQSHGPQHKALGAAPIAWEPLLVAFQMAATSSGSLPQVSLPRRPPSCAYPDVEGLPAALIAVPVTTGVLSLCFLSVCFPVFLAAGTVPGTR